MDNKPEPSVSKWLRNPEVKAAYEATKKEFILSELLAAIMEGDYKSVRELAKEAGISPSVIQNIRSGKQEDIKLTNFISIAEAFGYHLELVSNRDKQRIAVHPPSV